MSRSGPSLARVSAVAALILAAIVLLTLLTSDGTYRVSGVFEDVRGLIEGGEVKAGSAVVGSVETIEFNDDEMPVVTMKVDEDLELRQGAYADIRLASNVGGVNRFVDLEVGEGEPLHDGAMLGPSQTDQPVDIDLAVSELTPPRATTSRGSFPGSRPPCVTTARTSTARSVTAPPRSPSRPTCSPR